MLKICQLAKEPWECWRFEEAWVEWNKYQELPSSIECLTSLDLLTLIDCKNLVCLPSTICSLKLGNSLDLSRCSKFDNLPKNLGNVKGLEKLDFSGIAIKELFSSIECLTNLTVLTLKDCKNLLRLPNSIWSLKFGNSLDLFGCSNLTICQRT